MILVLLLLAALFLSAAFLLAETTPSTQQLSSLLKVPRSVERHLLMKNLLLLGTHLFLPAAVLLCLLLWTHPNSTTVMNWTEEQSPFIHIVLMLFAVALLLGSLLVTHSLWQETLHRAGNLFSQHPDVAAFFQRWSPHAEERHAPNHRPRQILVTLFLMLCLTFLGGAFAKIFVDTHTLSLTPRLLFLILGMATFLLMSIGLVFLTATLCLFCFHMTGSHFALNNRVRHLFLSLWPSGRRRLLEEKERFQNHLLRLSETVSILEKRLDETQHQHWTLRVELVQEEVAGVFLVKLHLRADLQSQWLGCGADGGKGETLNITLDTLKRMNMEETFLLPDLPPLGWTPPPSGFDPYQKEKQRQTCRFGQENNTGHDVVFVKRWLGQTHVRGSAPDPQHPT